MIHSTFTKEAEMAQDQLHEVAATITIEAVFFTREDEATAREGITDADVSELLKRARTGDRAALYGENVKITRYGPA
jgi:hypothetical protein